MVSVISPLMPVVVKVSVPAKPLSVLSSVIVLLATVLVNFDVWPTVTAPD